MPPPWCAVVFTVLWICVSVFVRADEEDPLQHASVAVTRNRTLHDILKLLSEEGPAVSEDNLKDDYCNHTQIEDLVVPGDLTARFKAGLLGALRLTKLLNALYLSPSNSSLLSSRRRDKSYLRSRQKRAWDRFAPSATENSDKFDGRGFRRRKPRHPDKELASDEAHVLKEILRVFLNAEISIVTLGLAFVREEAPIPGSLWGTYAWRDDQDRIVIGNLASLYSHQYDDEQIPGTKWFTEILQR